MPQVSIIVLTYNPDNRKLRQTLSMIAAQKDVSLEVIISDDGSSRKDYSFLPDFMAALGIRNYQLLDHKENRGTVQSCLRAVEAASGEYVFLTSPGDHLFDSYVLRDFYRFAQKNQAELCFGNAVFYTNDNGIPRTTRACGTPAAPQLFAPDSPWAKSAFFCGNWVIGASYFRSRALARSCLEQLADTAKYMEDTPTTAFALAEGHSLCYFDRNVVWYEDGTGVSTGANEKWNKLLHQDALQSFAKLKRLYPKDPCVDLAYYNLAQSNRFKRIARRLLRHPILAVEAALFKKAKKKPVACTEADLQQLTKLLQTQ